MLDKNTDSQVHRQDEQTRVHAFATGRMGLTPSGADPVLIIALIVGAISGTSHQDRRSFSRLFPFNSKDYKQYEAGLRFATEFDAVGRRRPFGAHNLEKLASGHHFQLVDGARLISRSGAAAPAPGKLPRHCSRTNCQGADATSSSRLSKPADHPRQAVVRGRHAGADRAVARARRGRQQQAGKTVAISGSDGRRPQRQRAQGRTIRRSVIPARNPQHDQARRADLQHPGILARLHHRNLLRRWSFARWCAFRR